MTMFLTGIVGVIVVGFFIAFTNTFTADRAATDSSTTAALGMNDVTRVIRAGTEIPVENQVLNIPVFERAENERMIIHAFIDTSSADPRPVKIEYYVNAQRELVERRYEAIALARGYWSFSSTHQGDRVIARQLPTRQSGDPWLFTYLTATGGEFTIPAGNTLNETQRRSVAAVRVTMTVQADITARAEPVTLRSTVGIPNLGISRVGL
ncbi:MAG: hypothetical protein ACXIUP_01550 [Microcella sp.]